MNKLLPLLLIVAAAPLAAQTVVTFNSPGYTTGNLNVSAGSAWVTIGGGDTFTVASGGLTGGAGGAQEVRQTNLLAGDATAFYNTAFDASQGALTVSAFFRYASVTPSGGTPFTLGISGATSHGLFNSATGAGDMILARINKAAGDTGTLTLQTRINGTGATAVTGASATFTNGNWYFLTTTLTRGATANQFTFTTSLFNATSAGVVGSLVDSIAATTVTSASLYNDTSLFTGFRGFTNNGLGGVDNFSVSQIPEPSSFAALAGLGMLGFASTRRKRRA